MQDYKEMDALKCQPLDVSLLSFIIKEYTGDSIYNEGVQYYQGYGRAIFLEDHIYEGTWDHGKMNGKGKFIWVDGVTYEGDFLNNALTGYGKYIWNNGSSYNGQVMNGMRHGKGVFTFSGNTSYPVNDSLEEDLCKSDESSYTTVMYDGEWKNGKKDGYGILKYEGCEIVCSYKGDWKTGMRHGSGRMNYPSGNYYFGQWKDDYKEGYGIMVWYTKQVVYAGNWAHDIQEGQGEQYWINHPIDTFDDKKILKLKKEMANRYEGSFKNGKRDGWGTFFYANGARYCGEWENDLKSGIGYLLLEDGRIIQESLMNDRQKNELDHNLTMDLNSPEYSKSSNEVSIPSQTQRKHSHSTDDKSKLYFYLDDIFAQYTGSKAVALDRPKWQKELDKVILRLTTDLKSIYNQYSKYHIGMDLNNNKNNRAGTQTYLMEMRDMWRLLYDCQILSNEFTIAYVNRHVFSKIKLQMLNKINETIFYDMKDDRNTIDNFDGIECNGKDIHNEYGVLIFRDFVEALIRISVIYCNDTSALGEKEDMTLANNFVTFYKQKMIINSLPVHNCAEDDDRIIYAPNVIAVLDSWSSSLGNLFKKYATMKEDGDHIITLRNFIQLMKIIGAFDKEFTYKNYLDKINMHSDSNNDDNRLNPFFFDKEFVFYEFKRELSRIILYKKIVTLPLCIVLEQFFKDLSHKLVYP